jgi:hypothetical protein
MAKNEGVISSKPNKKDEFGTTTLGFRTTK